ncbi:MAG: alpha/beta hydrolase family esterase [Massilia sp.]
MTASIQRLAACMALCAATAAHAADFAAHALARPEGERRYLVLDPGPPAGAVQRPVVILLHGHGEAAAAVLGRAAFAGYTPRDWAKVAEREHLLLIAPEGVKGSDGKVAWNDCRGDATTNATTDDVGFIGALIDKAVADFNVDPRRVYVFGFSNGGGMAYRLGIELAPRLAAIGVQSALMPARSRCAAPARPVSVFILHGTADPIAPYAGGDVGNWLARGRGSGLSAEATVAAWREVNGLSDTADVFRFPHLRADDPTTATRMVWGLDPAGVQVEFLRIDGGGHVHASKDEELPWLLKKILGPMNHDVDTAEEAWRFFRTRTR